MRLTQSMQCCPLSLWPTASQSPSRWLLQGSEGSTNKRQEDWGQLAPPGLRPAPFPSTHPHPPAAWLSCFPPERVIVSQFCPLVRLWPKFLIWKLKGLGSYFCPKKFTNLVIVLTGKPSLGFNPNATTAKGRRSSSPSSSVSPSLSFTSVVMLGVGDGLSAASRLQMIIYLQQTLCTEFFCKQGCPAKIQIRWWSSPLLKKIKQEIWQ